MIMQQDKTSQTFCHEDITADVNTSMITAKLSSSQHTESVMDKHDSIGASQHLLHVNDTRNSSKSSTLNFKYISIAKASDNFKYVNANGNSSETHSARNSYNSSSHSLVHVDDDFLEHFNDLWRKAESLMGDRFLETCKVLELFGIGDGEEDSDTEEGQLWRMIQGEAPYTLNLV